MSRSFTKNVSNYMSLGINGVNPLISGAGAVSVHVWAKPSSYDTGFALNTVFRNYINNSSSGVLMSINNGTSDLLVFGARSTTGDSFQSKTSTSTVPTGSWSSLGGVLNFAAGTVTPYFNGTAEGGGSVTFGASTYTPGTPSTVHDSIGSQLVVSPGSTTQQFNGSLSLLAIWTIALTGTNFSDLAAGAWPGAVGSSPPVLLMPLAGYSSPESSLVGGLSGTITGSVPAGSDDPGVWAPWRRSGRVMTGAI